MLGQISVGVNISRYSHRPIFPRCSTKDLYNAVVIVGFLEPNASSKILRPSVELEEAGRAADIFHETP